MVLYLLIDVCVCVCVCVCVLHIDTNIINTSAHLTLESVVSI